MHHPRRIRPALAVIVAIMVLAVFAPRATDAVSCAGNSHAMSLSAGTASPASGTTATRFTFRVTYTDNSACTPSAISVKVLGLGQFSLAYVGGNRATGATYSRTMRLPAGTWSYEFNASSGSGAGHRTARFTKVNPPTVRVAAPAPSPTPDPKPKPPAPTPPVTRPTTPPTPAPDPTATAAPQSTQAATPEPSPVRQSTSPADPPNAGGNSLARPGANGGGFDLASLPRAWLAAIASTIGTIGGLALFLLLGRRLFRSR
jgi:hypothetical protein